MKVLLLTCLHDKTTVINYYKENRYRSRDGALKYLFHDGKEIALNEIHLHLGFLYFFSFRPRLHGSGQIFARTNFVPGPPVYMDPCKFCCRGVAVVFTRIRAKFGPVAVFDSRP